MGWGVLEDAALFIMLLLESVYRPNPVSVINKGEAAHFQADDM